MTAAETMRALDPVTVDVARELGWTYARVHPLLEALAAAGASPAEALELLRACARAGAPPELVIRSAVLCALEDRRP